MEYPEIFLIGFRHMQPELATYLKAFEHLTTQSTGAFSFSELWQSLLHI